MFGFLNIYKPSGITSHDVISRLRKILKIKKIGHGGTLDPLAEGVLPVAVSGATRLIDFLPQEKEYIAEFQLGVISKSYDTETESEKFSDKKVSKSDINDILKNFLGEIKQKPPIYSAVKIDGKKLYQLARNGETAEIQERTVKIHQICLKEFNEELQTGKLLVNCSKGTYIRSVINDIGQILETGAVMKSLIRTKSGGMTVENSVLLEDIKDASEAENRIISVSEILNFPKISITPAQFERVKNGNNITYEHKNGYVFTEYNNQIIALGEVINNVLKIRKVFV